MSRPNRIDDWDVVGDLGEPSSFATVYRVRDAAGVEYALKWCLSTNEPSEKRMEIEEAALRDLALPDSADPPYIPRLFGSGRMDDRRYLVMSLAAGQTLKRAIEERYAAGGVHGYIEAMRILAKLLVAVRHVHEHNLVHRDVKDANVVYDPATGTVTLIDFGFAKPPGPGATRSSDSFWRAGAERFSPLAKLREPTRVVANHDVFSVGVIGYRLLTARYPWEAASGEDATALKNAMRTQPLIPVNQINSMVIQPASDIISAFLDLDDHKRPSAAAALARIEEFLRAVEDARSGDGRLLRRVSQLSFFPKRVRDSLYGDVMMTAYEWRVLDSAELQRLRGIKQLALTDLVFPGATHTRFSHAIGCLGRVEQILTMIERKDGIRVDDDIRAAARLYALTHDVTQIPYGRTIEDELGFFRRSDGTVMRHDANSDRARRLLDGTGSELGEVLKDDEVGRDVRRFLEGEAAALPDVVKDLVAGPVGADVLDYVDRDSFYCGLDHRIDTALFRQLQLERSEGGRLVSLFDDKYGLRVDRRYALESVLRERYALFLKVYTNRSKAAASALLGKALTAAILPGDGPPILTEELLERFTDERLLDFLASRPEAAIRQPVDELRHRRLPRAVYRTVPTAPDHSPLYYSIQLAKLAELGALDPVGRAALEARIAALAGVEPATVLIHCPTAAPGYRLAFEHRVASPTGGAISDPGTELVTKHLALWALWVFVRDEVDEDKQAVVGQASATVFQRPNSMAYALSDGR